MGGYGDATPKPWPLVAPTAKRDLALKFEIQERMSTPLLCGLLHAAFAVCVCVAVRTLCACAGRVNHGSNVRVACQHRQHAEGPIVDQAPCATKNAWLVTACGLECPLHNLVF